MLDLVYFLSSVESWRLIKSSVNWLGPGESYLRILWFKLILNVRNIVSEKIPVFYIIHGAV